MKTEDWNLKSKVVMITGATSGLGRVSALALARRGAELYLVCRNAARAEETAQEITAATGNGNVQLLIGDLSSQRTVREIANRFLATGKPLHVLLNNAGGCFGFKRSLSEDGHELTFALNHLAYYTLTLLLIPRMIRSVPARIVNVASDGYPMGGGRFPFDDFNAERSYNPIRRYGASKLANILFTRELARRLNGKGVTVNAASPPGLTATRFAYSAHRFARYAMALTHPFSLSEEEGARSQLHLCTAPELAHTSGEFFVGLERPALRPEAQNDEDAYRLWSLSEKLTGLSLS